MIGYQPVLSAVSGYLFQAHEAAVSKVGERGADMPHDDFAEQHDA
jgi:hypothetical protein